MCSLPLSSAFSIAVAGVVVIKDTRKKWGGGDSFLSGNLQQQPAQRTRRDFATWHISINMLERRSKWSACSTRLRRKNILGGSDDGNYRCRYTKVASGHRCELIRNTGSTAKKHLSNWGWCCTYVYFPTITLAARVKNTCSLHMIGNKQTNKINTLICVLTKLLACLCFTVNLNPASTFEAGVKSAYFPVTSYLGTTDSEFGQMSAYVKPYLTFSPQRVTETIKIMTWSDFEVWCQKYLDGNHEKGLYFTQTCGRLFNK